MDFLLLALSNKRMHDVDYSYWWQLYKEINLATYIAESNIAKSNHVIYRQSKWSGLSPRPCQLLEIPLFSQHLVGFSKTAKNELYAFSLQSIYFAV